jgi:hypothetical protein
MKKSEDEVERVLSALGGIRPPEELRGRTLARAGQAWSQAVPAEAAPADPWRRIWESRPLRFAWAATVLILLALAVAPWPGEPHPAPSSAAAAASAAAAPELAAVLHLPRVDLESAPAESEAAGSAGRAGGAPAASRPEKERT